MSNQNYPNESTVEALMHEKHTLIEWQILFLQHPELWDEFDKLVKPEPLSSMSKRAKKAALKAFPKYYGKVEMPDGSTIVFERDEREREIFIEGYEQAEKDLALTWEDIAKIDSLIIDPNNEFAVDYQKKISRQHFYEEVLKKYLQIKNQSQQAE